VNPRTDAATPARVGSYRIEERLGAGGMGVVYRGFDEALLRPVALKRLLPDRVDVNTRKRFRREAQAASRLNHPSIVHIYDIVETPEGDWIVMELVEGRPLDEIAGELDVAQALRIAREIAEGLAEAHGIGVIHRDLKTSNVMITRAGRAKILDFGIAKLAQGSDDTVLSQIGTIIGTFHAMSPEQAMGRPIDPRSDLFSLGTLLYELLTGTSPFRGSNSTETLARVCSYRQPPAHRMHREVSTELSELVDQLLQKDPDLRPRSAQEVAEALDLAARGLLPSSLGREAPPSLPPTWIDPPTWNPPTLEQTLREGYQPPHQPPSVSVSESRRTVRERRQVTVACCELTAFRETGGRVEPTVVDPEALAEILPEVKAMAGRMTERFSGQVGDTLGRRMVLCFGYPQAHEDAAARAVRAALDFVAEVERLADRVARLDTGSGAGGTVGEIRLALRAGVHTGTAIVLPDPEPPSLGATLDTAAGLLLHAAPGEVLVSTATHRLLRDAFTTERRSPVEDHGTGESVDAFRILEAAGPPEPTSAAFSGGPLIGRERELDLLLDLWRRSAEGTGQVALISGEAGIGKSRLIQALRERVGQEGPAGDSVRWLYAYGSPHDQSSPLQPVVNVLRKLVDSQEAATPVGRIEELLRPYALPPSETLPLFASLLGLPLEEPYRLPGLSPDRIREKTLEAVAALTLEMAERQPLVWILEDLHWLDPTTMRWLDLLIEQASSVPLFLVLTVRPQTLEAVWGPKGHITQLNLAALAQADVERLIERLIERTPGKELSEALRREIAARTDGVPLFVEELTKTVLESGRSGGRPDIPSTLRDSLATRLDRLGDAKGVAQIASVIGRSFSLELLAAVSSGGTLDDASLQRELRRLVQAELVFRRGFGSRTSYLFKHALIRDAAYDSLLTRERQQLHLRVAQALEKTGQGQEAARPEILAYHYAEGNLPEKAVAHWLEAARQALGRSAHLEALHHVRSGLAALASLPPGPARDERELQLQTTLAPAVIATQGFSSPEVERAYLRGLELCGEQQGRFELLYGLFSFYAVQAKPDRALVLGEQMLQLAESQGSAVYLVQSRYGLGAMSFLLGDFAASRRHLSAALAQDDPELGQLLPLSFGTDDRKTCVVYDALDLWLLGHPDQALERCRTAIAWTRETPQPFTLTTVLLLSGFLHRFRRDDTTVRRHAEEMIALSEEHGLFQVRDANVLLGLALAAGEEDPDAGIEHLKTSLEAYRATGFRVFLSFYLAELAAACLRRGRLEESEAALQEAFGAVHAGSERFWEPELHRLRGELLALSSHAGATDEAEAAFRKALATAAGRSAASLELRAAVSLARLWQGGGQRDEARQLLSSTYARFSDGLATADTPDIAEAGALLNALA
jgi:serine/threonine protein kinase/predicted ATPase